MIIDVKSLAYTTYAYSLAYKLALHEKVTRLDQCYFRVQLPLGKPDEHKKKPAASVDAYAKFSLSRDTRLQ